MINNELEVGQVLWLKVRYQIDIVSNIKYPMLIVQIEDDYIEVIALDKTAGKLHQLFHEYNYYLNCSKQNESAIKEDSYAQLNTKITIDKIDELKNIRKTLNKLLSFKLKELLKEYERYQFTRELDENRIVVHMTKEKIVLLNEELKDEIYN